MTPPNHGDRHHQWDIAISAFQSFSVAVAVFDRTGHCIYVNRTAERVFNGTLGELVGEHYSTRRLLAHADAFGEKFLEVVESSRPRLLRLTQATRDYEVEIVAADSLFLAFFRDLTEGRRIELLQTVTASLSRAVSTLDVAKVMVDEGARTVGAPQGAVWMLSEDEQTLRLVYESGHKAGFAATVTQIAVGSDWPVAQCVTQQRPIWVESIEDFDDRFPETKRLTQRDGFGVEDTSFFCLPLLVGGTCRGAYYLGYTNAQKFHREQRAFIEALVDYCAQALERARLSEAEQTARREAGTAQRRFRAVFEHVLDGIILSNDASRVVDANPAAARLFGRTRDDLIGRRAVDLIPEADWHRSRQAADRLLELGTQTGELRIQRADGSVRHVEYGAVANFLQGMHLLVLHDVEDRLRTENALRFLGEASAVLASSLDHHKTLDGVAQLAVPNIADWVTVHMTDTAGNLRRVAVAHRDPAKAEELRAVSQKNPARPNGVGDVEKVLESGNSMLVPEVTDAMVRSWVEDPELFKIVSALGISSSMCVPLKIRGGCVGAITLIASESRRHFDAADLAFAEELARRASTSLENAQAFREAQEANRTKDEFLATVSHELRTPLNAILGWTSMLRTKADVDVDKALATIERNGRAQVRLIDDVLDVSRIVTGKLRVEPKPVDLSAILKAALDVVSPMAAAKGIAISTDIVNSPCAFNGDADRLQQVFWNLLSNAVKFTPPRGTVQVSLVRTYESVEISVTDSGRGIRADFLPLLFERFRQADSTTARREGGLGLGLAIVRHLVELHGGTASASSEGEGKGSRFVVSLPTRLPETTEQRTPTSWQVARREYRAPSEPAGPGCLEGIRVLICDDDADARDLLVHVLSSEGSLVRVTSAADETLDELRRFRPDVLVSDIGLPGVDGYALIGRVRALPAAEGGRTPAVALTAYARGEDARKAFLAGFQLHVAKPVEPGDLVAIVANLAGRAVRR
jgi:PAS domain S-box-containing protein